MKLYPSMPDPIHAEICEALSLNAKPNSSRFVKLYPSMPDPIQADISEAFFKNVNGWKFYIGLSI